MFPVPSTEGPEAPSVTPEFVRFRKLWLNVILRAREDAEGRDLMSNNEGEGEIRRLKREGRQWLTGDTLLRPLNRKDLELVSEWAGVDVEALVEISRRRYYGR